MTERIFPNIHPVLIVPSSAEMKYKTDLLRAADSAARGYDERIAQMIVMPFLPVTFDLVDELSETERGAGGFGSTGK